MTDGRSPKVDGARVMDTDVITPISKPYLLVTFLPFHVDNAGEVWLDRLWHKDLVEHTVYIKNLLLLAEMISNLKVCALRLV